ncbi:MAG: hypothetical protein VW946_05625 [Gammaproteobacteria bacterium]
MDAKLINYNLKISPNMTIRDSKVVQVLSAEVTIPFIKGEQALRFETKSPEAIFFSIYYPKLNEEYKQPDLMKIIHNIVQSSGEVSQVQMHTFFQWNYWFIDFSPCKWRTCSEAESNFFHTNMQDLLYDINEGFNLSFKKQHEIFKKGISDVI